MKTALLTMALALGCIWGQQGNTTDAKMAGVAMPPKLERDQSAFTPKEATAFQELLQEQRVNAAELKAAKADQERLNEVGMRMITSACNARGVTAPDFSTLMEVCKVDFTKGTVTKAAPPAKEAHK